MNSTVMQQRLGATITGTGERVVVLANGLGTSQNTWRHVVTALQHRARFVRFDNVCSPMSPPGGYRAEVYNTLFAYTDDVVGLLDELDVHDCLFVGHSISGIIGLLAAVAAPERIGRLALICSTPRFLTDVDFRAGFPRARIDEILDAAQHDYPAWAREFSAAAIGSDASSADLEEFRALLTDMRPDIALRVLQAVFFGDHRAMLGRVQQPVCVLHAQEDVMVPSSAGEYLVQQLPDARLVPLSSTGHVPHLTAPAEVIHTLSHLLDTWS